MLKQHLFHPQKSPLGVQPQPLAAAKSPLGLQPQPLAAAKSPLGVQPQPLAAANVLFVIIGLFAFSRI